MEDCHNSTHPLSRRLTGDSVCDQRQTILLVDDDDENLENMSEIMRMHGYEVASFHDALSALSAISKGIRPDLVMTDYRMPVMNGLEFIETLRHQLPIVPVIMLTAYGNIDTYLKAFNLGIFEYINKPVNTGELLKIVKVALDKSMGGTDFRERFSGHPFLIDSEV